jgi:hypothetical protein
MEIYCISETFDRKMSSLSILLVVMMGHLSGLVVV